MTPTETLTYGLGEFHVFSAAGEQFLYLVPSTKYDCHSCRARPLCAGGCHHEAFVRYGDTGHPNLNYCDWIRAWTEICLRIYGAIAVQGPEFLNYFSERKAS